MRFDLFRTQFLAVALCLPQCLLLYADGPPCLSNDASATFSLGLAIPPAQSAAMEAVRSAIERGNFKQASELLHQSPLDAEEKMWEGALLLQEKKTFSSIRSLEESARLKDSSIVESLLAIDYFLLNQRKLTERTLEQALKLNPNDARVFFLLGRFHYDSQNFTQARTDFDAVLRLEPSDYQTQYYRGMCEWRLGDIREAQKALLQAVEVLVCHRIDFPLAPRAAAELELGTAQADAALGDANLAVAMAEHNNGTEPDLEEIATALYWRGKVEFTLGRQSEAERDWRRAVTLNPILAEGWYSLARLYRQRGQPQLATEALAQFQKIHDEL